MKTETVRLAAPKHRRGEALNGIHYGSEYSRQHRLRTGRWHLAKSKRAGFQLIFFSKILKRNFKNKCFHAG